ncbi:MAG TPA: hypothetical protein VN915_03560 [Elusimicrobiota bacterium]|nr:hypothetical protein [Elusimicrobiota bacterium]
MKALLFLALAAILSAAAVPDDQARAPQRVLSPARADGINDFAVFGPGAAEVSVYDRRGRRVFHAVRQGGAAIVWDCKDPSGRVRGAGVYVARIRKTDAGVIYQSFVLVR